MFRRDRFPYLKRTLEYFDFDECFREGVSVEEKREASREIFQNISRHGRAGQKCRRISESILRLKVAVVYSLYKDLRSIDKVAEVLGCSKSTATRCIPQEMKNEFSLTDEKFVEAVDRIGPCYYIDLAEELKIKRNDVCQRARGLETKGLITITSIPAVSHGGKYRTSELFDGLSGAYTPRRIVWNHRNPGHREQVIETFKKAILVSGPLTPGKKNALTRHLGRLPEDVFNELHEWYTRPADQRD